MKIVVDETHRQRSAQERTGTNICRRCPVALAVRDAFPYLDIQAGADCLFIADPDGNYTRGRGIEWKYTEKVYNWVNNYDMSTIHKKPIPDLEFDFDPKTGIID